MEHDLTGKGIGIAFLDTGIFPHIDFDSRILAFKDFINHIDVPYDNNGHGTHTAGIAAGNGECSYGRYQGVAPEAFIISLKVLDQYGNGDKDLVLDALNWILVHHKQYGIRIVNISVGTTEKDYHIHKKLIDAVERVWDAGLVVVAAAGNMGPKPGSVTAPGSSRKVITVGSSDMITSALPISGRGPTRECISCELCGQAGKVYCEKRDFDVDTQSIRRNCPSARKISMAYQC